MGVRTFNIEQGLFISVGKGYRNLCESEECKTKSFKSNSVEGIMYRNLCTKEEAFVEFRRVNAEQQENRMATFQKLHEDNPNFYKEKSRNTKEFYIKKGYSEEESIQLAKEVMSDIHKKTFAKFKDNPGKYIGKYTTNIEYYIKKGYSIDKAKETLTTRQTTFSLEICIEKHGDVEGGRIWKERQDKWMKTMDSKTDTEKIEINRKKLDGSGFSKVSQILFWDIYNSLLVPDDYKIMFKELNREFFLLTINKQWFAYDLVSMNKKNV